jgi:hypothetical protein
MKFLLTTALSAFVALGTATVHAQEDETTDPYGEEAAEEVDEQIDEESGAYGEEAQPPATEEMEQPAPAGEQGMEGEETETVPVIPVVPVDPDEIERDQERVMEGDAEMTEEEKARDEEVSRRAPTAGIGVSAGAGVIGFSNGDVNDIIDPGVAYTARLHVGGNSPIGFEAGYIGSAHNVDAAGLDGDSVLVSNGIEGAVRLNLGTGLVQPYVLGGLAWRRYDITNEDFNTSDVREEDDVLEIPVGAGLAWRYGGVLVDGRAAYSFATQEDLLPGVEDDDLGLDSWNFTLRAGFEF